MNLSVISNIYEPGIIDYLIRFAFDSRSNPRDLWQTVRNAAIDQHGLGVTVEQIDTESEALFIGVVTHHFRELTTEHITALLCSKLSSKLMPKLFGSFAIRYTCA
jgi:hypothetical protein